MALEHMSLRESSLEGQKRGESCQLLASSGLPVAMALEQGSHCAPATSLPSEAFSVLPATMALEQGSPWGPAFSLHSNAFSVLPMAMALEEGSRWDTAFSLHSEEFSACQWPWHWNGVPLAPHLFLAF